MNARAAALVACLVAGFVNQADAQTASLTIQVVPAVGAAGCLSGSMCPPGTWFNDIDEHFTGTSLNTSIWTAGVNGAQMAGATSDCQTPGALVVNNGLTISALPNVPGGGAHGCVVWSQGGSQTMWSTPGYFEFYAQTDTGYSSGSNIWNGIFFEFGPNAGCGGNFSQNGGEVDLVETYATGGSLSQQSVNFNGYGPCPQATIVFGHSPSADGYHLWGLDYGDNNNITFYKDGNQIDQYAPAPGVEPAGACPTSYACFNGKWYGQVLFFDQSFPNTNFVSSSGEHIAWFRHYHH